MVARAKRMVMRLLDHMTRVVVFMASPSAQIIWYRLTRSSVLQLLAVVPSSASLKAWAAATPICFRQAFMAGTISAMPILPAHLPMAGKASTPRGLFPSTKQTSSTAAIVQIRGLDGLRLAIALIHPGSA